MRSGLAAWSTLIILGLSAPAFAHHPFAAEYDWKKPMSIEGTVSSFEWRNPHSTLTIESKDNAGKAIKWTFELDSPAALTSLGWNANQFKVGERVTAEGWAAKDGSKRVSAKSVMTNGKALYATATFFDAPRAGAGTVAARASGTANRAEVGLVGWVEREADYRQARNSGRGGVLGTGVGVGDEFVVTRTTQPMAASSYRAVGTAGTTDNAFALTGDLEKELVRGIGRQVLIIGMIEPDSTLPRINVTLWHPIADFCPAK